MASVYALYQKYKDQDQSYVMNDLQTMRTAASALNAIYPNSDFVKAMYQNTLQLVKQQRAAGVRKFIQENGDNSPDIVLPDLNDKNIALSSLRGKVVLLQFWAAEDRNSRLLNPLLVEAYKKYKNKGFEIYQVNIGKNRSEWIDAIDTDKLEWINVGDMEGCVQAINLYNVRSIPSNYLLDKDGTIVAKDLTGPNLDKALAQLLK
jgi:thiol-disulfide isomerase/thioredoxin